MERLALCVLCSALTALTFGCSDDSNGSGGTSGAGGTGGSGGVAGAGGSAGMGGTGGMGGGETTLLSVTITEAPSLDDQLFEGPPLEGAELCEADTTNCATSDAEGEAQIMLPAFQEVTYTVSKEGYAPYVVGDVTGAPALTSTWPMISDALMAAEAERVGIAWPSEDGLLALAVLPAQAGVTWAIDDEAATVYYMDEDNVADTDLTATTSAGRGGFYDASPGTREVEFGGTASNCTPGIAWPGDAANQIRAPVRAEHISYGSMTCDAP